MPSVPPSYLRMPQGRHSGFHSLTQCQQTLLSLGTPTLEPLVTGPGQAQQGSAATADVLRLVKSSFLCFTICAFPVLNHWGYTLPWEGTATLSWQ